MQVADLTNATVACAADDEIDRPNVIKIDTKTWVKKGKSMTTQRTFWIQAVNKPELDEWMLLLQLTNERAQMESSSALADESAAAAAAGTADCLLISCSCFAPCK